MPHGRRDGLQRRAMVLFPSQSCIASVSPLRVSDFALALWRPRSPPSRRRPAHKRQPGLVDRSRVGPPRVSFAFGLFYVIWVGLPRSSSARIIGIVRSCGRVRPRSARRAFRVTGSLRQRLRSRCSQSAGYSSSWAGGAASLPLFWFGSPAFGTVTRRLGRFGTGALTTAVAAAAFEPHRRHRPRRVIVAFAGISSRDLVRSRWACTAADCGSAPIAPYRC